MKTDSEPAHSRFAAICRWAVLWVVVLGCGNLALAQSEPSLGDVARQARSDRGQSTSDHSNTTTQQLTNALQEDQEDSAAPEGFATYLADGYRVWVPAPFSVEGRDEAGTLLATADVTGITTKVFVASPIPNTRKLSEIEYKELAQQFWRPYGGVACTKAKPGATRHLCSVTGNLLGNSVNGQATFVQGTNIIVPVVCFANYAPQQRIDFAKGREQVVSAALSNMRQEAIRKRSQDLCGTVLDSVRLKDTTINVGRAKAPAQIVPVAATGGGEGTSLGEIARTSREEALQAGQPKVRVESEDTINRAPAGFRNYGNMRCVSGTCWEETLFLPQNARRVTGGNSDTVYVAMLDENTSVIIYFGTTDVWNGYSEFGRASEVAHGWVHAQFDYNAKPLRTVRTINGRDVSIVRTRSVASMNAWDEEVAAVGVEGVNVSIGCLAREDRFVDAEAVCSTVFDSWRISR